MHKFLDPDLTLKQFQEENFIEKFLITISTNYTEDQRRIHMQTARCIQLTQSTAQPNLGALLLQCEVDFVHIKNYFFVQDPTNCNNSLPQSRPKSLPK